MARLEVAAICTPGLEPVCEAELAALGIRSRAVGAGVVEFKPTTRQLYAATLWLRTASRVLVRMAKFKATDFNFLVTRAKEVEWEQFLPDGYAPEFRVTSRKSALYHTEGIADRLHGVVGEANAGLPTQSFVVRGDRDVFTVSADASGVPLHHRAWREDLGIAPLRPTMASALLMANGWDGTKPLIDPFCGSGTIAIEAALLARNMPPGGDRDFSFAYWPDFEPGTWASVMGGVMAGLRDESPVSIEASDRDPQAVEATIANAERAGVLGDIEVSKRVISHLTGHQGDGLIAMNPPYGKRVGDGDLGPLYKKFGAVLRERRPGWSLAMVANDVKLARTADLRLVPLAGFGHGGLKVQILSRQGSVRSDSPPGDLTETSADPRPDPTI